VQADYQNIPKLDVPLKRVASKSLLESGNRMRARKIERHVEKTDSATAMDTVPPALERRREKTRALKLAMMQELLTGRTRLV